MWSHIAYRHHKQNHSHKNQVCVKLSDVHKYHGIIGQIHYGFDHYDMDYIEPYLRWTGRSCSAPYTASHSSLIRNKQNIIS